MGVYWHCKCKRICTESWLWEKNPCRTRELNLCQQRVSLMLYQLNYIPIHLLGSRVEHEVLSVSLWKWAVPWGRDCQCERPQCWIHCRLCTSPQQQMLWWSTGSLSQSTATTQQIHTIRFSIPVHTTKQHCTTITATHWFFFVCKQSGQLYNRVCSFDLPNDAVDSCVIKSFPCPALGDCCNKICSPDLPHEADWTAV